MPAPESARSPDVEPVARGAVDRRTQVLSLPRPGRATDALKIGVIPFAAAAVLAALTVYLLIVGKNILVPFVQAVLVWYLINALANVSRLLRIRGHVIPRWLRFAAAIAMLVMISWSVVNLVIGNIGYVMALAPTYEQNLRVASERMAGWVGLEEVPRLTDMLQGGRLTQMIRAFVLGLTGLLGSLGTIALYVVFLLLEQHSFGTKIAAICRNPDREAKVHAVLHRIGAEIQSYVWLKTVMSVVTAVASYAVMYAVGVDLAGFWALLIFGLNYIPYIGAWLGVIFPAMLALVQFDTIRPFLVTVGALSVVQFTCGSIIEPRLMGGGLNLSPVVMLLSLVLWGTLWGVVGMLLAVPLMVVFMIICSQFEPTRPIAILMSATGELHA